MATSAAEGGAPPLAKYLASNDKKVRDKAVKNLAGFLSNDSGDALPDVEMAKLWKGIFYCFWMSDKPLVQQALASELAELLLTIKDTSSSLNFLRGFWITTVREWSGIDRLRMDKYYMLVRRFVSASFRLLIRTNWDESTYKIYTDILTGVGGPLCPTDIKVPSSLTFHLSEIYLDELEKAMTVTANDISAPTPLCAVLNPFLSLAAGTQAKLTYKHVEKTVFQPLIAALKEPIQPHVPSGQKRPRTELPTSSPSYPSLLSNSCARCGETQPLDTGELKTSILQRLFAVASEEVTRDANRRKMYAFYNSCTEDDEDNAG